LNSQLRQREEEILRISEFVTDKEIENEHDLIFENEGLREQLSRATSQLDYYREVVTGHRTNGVHGSIDLQDSEDLRKANKRLSEELEGERAHANRLVKDIQHMEKLMEELRKEPPGESINSESSKMKDEFAQTIESETVTDFEPVMRQAHKIIRDHKTKRICKYTSITGHVNGSIGKTIYCYCYLF
jgi:hypothetical protein